MRGYRFIGYKVEVETHGQEIEGEVTKPHISLPKLLTADNNKRFLKDFCDFSIFCDFCDFLRKLIEINLWEISSCCQRWVSSFWFIGYSSKMAAKNRDKVYCKSNDIGLDW